MQQLNPIYAQISQSFGSRNRVVNTVPFIYYITASYKI